MFPYGVIYGPHLSKRFGLSLGVDLTPMSCTFNCVYCERGATRFGCTGSLYFIPKVERADFRAVLEQTVKNLRFDGLTFAGTGEPTLDLRLGEFINLSRKLVRNMPIRVITNASQLLNTNVRQNLAEADEVIAKLNTVSEDLFVEMHRPFDKTLQIESIIKGLHALKQEIGKKLVIEILFIRSYQLPKTNSTDEEVGKLGEVLRDLEPGKIQIHTIRRMPAEPYVLPVSKRFLDYAATYLKNRLFHTQVSVYL